jgi:hypothetical protein
MERQYCNTLISLLKIHAESYYNEKARLSNRTAAIKSQFNFPPEQGRQLEFGTIIPADRSLQYYADIINSDSELIEISEKINDIIMEGCSEIFKELVSKRQIIPGYDLESFIDNPNDNVDEILNLMQSFGGYKHIHTFNDFNSYGKIALEVPALEYIQNDLEVTTAINYWIDTVIELSF